MNSLSPSPSISSSSTAAFDADMCTSKSATAGCLAGILRRILCSGSLPTHPSDHITEANSVEFDKPGRNMNAAEKVEPKANPGIVARLMGLDSMPILLSSEVISGSITRSRSMNSVDYKAVDRDQMEGKHRRVKSSLSFPVMPDFLELENEEFFILSFENGSGSDELRLKEREFREKSFRELRQRRRKNSENKAKKSIKMDKRGDQENEKHVLNVVNEKELNRKPSVKPLQEVSNGSRVKDSTNTSCSTQNFREEPDLVLSRSTASEEGAIDGKSRKKKQKRQHLVVENAEHVSSSEESSPVSVLDFDQSMMDQQASPSAEKGARLEETTSRRKLSPELDSCRHLPRRNDNNLIEERRKRIGSRTRDGLNQIYMDMWGEICRMTETEIAESTWVHAKVLKHEDVEDINGDVGSHILDQMLEEIVYNFLGFPGKI